MKPQHTAICLVVISFLYLGSRTDAQVVFTSVRVTASASTGGTGSFPGDSEAFSFDTFTNLTEVSAASGILLNSSFANTGAGAVLDNGRLSIEAFATADQFSPPFTASANSLVEVMFRLDSRYTVSLDGFVASSSTFSPGTRSGVLGVSFADNEFFDFEGFAENTFLDTDSNTPFTSNDFGGLAEFTVGPGNYLIRSESQASAVNDFASGSGNAFVGLEFTPVPEPSSQLALLGSFLVFALTRRRMGLPHGVAHVGAA